MTHEEMMNADPKEILDTFIDQKKLHNMEGDRGLENLNKIAKAIGYGYRGHGFKFGSPLEELLADNSGACNAILNFIKDNISEEQAECVSDELELEEETEEEIKNTP